VDKYIFHKRKALTLHECESIIENFESITQVGTKTDEKRIDNQRDYTSVGGDLRLRKYSSVYDTLTTSIREYRKKHLSIDVTGDWKEVNVFNIQKYDPGQCFDEEHCEHGPCNMSSRRVLAWMIYLNDIKNKGGTHWPQQKFTSKPRAGDLYIWPASWTHTHYGVPAPKEIKYILTGWYSYLTTQQIA
tara:strand:- start:92 stop:655 length:564 start_codon:yes stop_codon:yes gene_type:complete